MPDYISSKEFERTFKQMNKNVSKMVEFKEKQIGINAKVDSDIEGVKEKQSYFIKLILIVLGCFGGFAGIGFYSSVGAEQSAIKPQEELKVKTVKVKEKE